MRRFLRIRILFVLIALLLVPALALPFAERLRAEWSRYWAPRVEAAEEPPFAIDAPAGGADWCWTGGYASPVIEAGCYYREAPMVDAGPVVADFPGAETATEQERFLRTMELIDLENVPIPDEPPLSYPTAERSEEIRMSLAKERAARAAP